MQKWQTKLVFLALTGGSATRSCLVVTIVSLDVRLTAVNQAIDGYRRHGVGFVVVVKHDARQVFVNPSRCAAKKVSLAKFIASTLSSRSGESASTFANSI